MSNDCTSQLNQDHSENHQPLERELHSSLQQIGVALRGLRFGSVNVIVQDGVVVQIDRTEKIRLRNAASPK